MARTPKVYILDRQSLQLLTSFGDGGRQPGYFGAHSIATDSHGNIYTTETYEGKRVQKFSALGPCARCRARMPPVPDVWRRRVGVRSDLDEAVARRQIVRLQRPQQDRLAAGRAPFRSVQTGPV